MHKERKSFIINNHIADHINLSHAWIFIELSFTLYCEYFTRYLLLDTELCNNIFYLLSYEMYCIEVIFFFNITVINIIIDRIINQD